MNRPCRELSVALLTEWLVKYKFKNWRKTETRQLSVTAQMKKERADAIARDLNETKKWHVHGHGISMQVLQDDLKVQIDDFGSEPELAEAIGEYNDLLSDYMSRRGTKGVLHYTGNYTPFM